MKEYKISFEDYYQAQKLFLGWKRWFLEIVILLFALILGSALLMIIHSIFDLNLLSEPYIILMFVLGTLIGFAVTLYKQKKMYKKIYDTQKSFRENIQITFTDEYIEWRSESGYYKLAWKVIYKYKYDENMIIISESQNMIRIIPNRVFESNDEQEHFLKNLNAFASAKTR